MPSHWQETSIGDVASVVSERVDPTSLESGIYVGLEHLVSGARRLSGLGSVSEVSSSTTPFLPGDTLFGRLRPYLQKGVVAPVAGVCSPEILVIRGQAGIDPRFLGLLVLRDAVFEECNRLSAGSRMPRTSAKDLMGLSVLMPPLAEQRRITDLVGSIDGYLDSLQSQVAATRLARSAVLTDLLSGRPSNRQEVAVGDVVELQRQRVDPTRLDGNVQLLHWSIPGLDETGGPVSETASQIGSHKFKVANDSVLLSLLNPRIPRFTTAEGGSNVVCSTEFAVLTPTDSISIGFLACTVSSPNFLERLLSLAQGTTKSRERIKPADLLALPIQVPEVPEQHRIVELIGAVDAQIASLKSQLDRTRTFRDAILADLLSGKRLLDESYDVAVTL